MIQSKKYSTGGNNIKLYADLMLTFSMVASGIIMGMPLPDNTKLWINSIIGFIGMGGKLLTNVVEFKTKEENETSDPGIAQP